MPELKQSTHPKNPTDFFHAVERGGSSCTVSLHFQPLCKMRRKHKSKQDAAVQRSDGPPSSNSLAASSDQNVGRKSKTSARRGELPASDVGTKISEPGGDVLVGMSEAAPHPPPSSGPLLPGDCLNGVELLRQPHLPRPGAYTVAGRLVDLGMRMG